MSLLTLTKLYIVNIMCYEYESEDKTMKNTARTFTMEDITKVTRIIGDRHVEIVADGSAKVKVIDKGNHKTGVNIPVFNLPPIVTCGGNCGACMHRCYAVKDYMNYRVKTVSTNHVRNMVALQTDFEKAFADLDKWLTKHKPAFFRIHASGDFGLILNGDKFAYGRMWHELAKRHPETCFLAFTKCYDVARQVPFDELPNFELVLSEWTDELVAPADLKKRYRTSRAVNELEDARDNEMICPGNCDTCGMCWNLSKTNHDVAFEIH